MYFLLNMGIFQPAMLVYWKLLLRGVFCFPDLRVFFSWRCRWSHFYVLFFWGLLGTWEKTPSSQHSSKKKSPRKLYGNLYGRRAQLLRSFFKTKTCTHVIGIDGANITFFMSFPLHFVIIFFCWRYRWLSFLCFIFFGVVRRGVPKFPTSPKQNPTVCTEICTCSRAQLLRSFLTKKTCTDVIGIDNANITMNVLRCNPDHQDGLPFRKLI